MAGSRPSREVVSGGPCPPRYRGGRRRQLVAESPLSPTGLGHSSGCLVSDARAVRRDVLRPAAERVGRRCVPRDGTCPDGRGPGTLWTFPTAATPSRRGRVTGLKLRVRRARGRGWFPQRIRPACAPEDQAWTRGLAVSGLASGSPGDCPFGFLSEAARPWRSWARDGSGPPQGTRGWGHVSSYPCGSTPLGDREPGAGHTPRNAGGPDGCWTDPREGAPTVFGPWVQCAFNLSMFSVSCNSHYDTQFAAVFIDPRAE